MGWWDGHVDNQSKKAVWALVDDHEGQVYAKKVPAGKKTPNNIDIDAVKPVEATTTINGYDSWWRLAKGNAVTIKDRANNSNDLEMTGAIYGSLEKKKENDWGRPGGNIRYDTDTF